MKRCWKCKRAVPVEQFGRNAFKSDGLSDECRPCRRASRREYYLTHRDDVCRRTATWKKRNRARVNELNRRSRSRPHIKARDAAKRRAVAAETAVRLRRYYLKNRDRILCRSKAYYRANRATIQPKTRKWTIANKDKSRIYAINYQAKRRAWIAGAKVAKTDLAAIAMRDRMRCYLCGLKIRPKDLAFDHVTPLSKGGAHSNENIRPTHRSCNSSKQARLVLLPLEPKTLKESHAHQ